MELIAEGRKGERGSDGMDSGAAKFTKKSKACKKLAKYTG
jgi:hypothetical protein